MLLIIVVGPQVHYLTFAIVPSTGNTGLLVVDTESSYVRFNYDPVPTLGH